MGGSSKKQVIGHRYHLGMHLIWCHGEADKLIELQWDRKIGWSGNQTGSGSISISSEELFGGKKKEGGVSGVVDFYTGSWTQGQNAYLQSQLGSDIPAFRGVCGLVLRGAGGAASVGWEAVLGGSKSQSGFYLGMNPYLKLIAGKLQRIHKTTNGATQWYNSKAEIPATADIVDNGISDGYIFFNSVYAGSSNAGMDPTNTGAANYTANWAQTYAVGNAVVATTGWSLNTGPHDAGTATGTVDLGTNKNYSFAIASHNNSTGNTGATSYAEYEFLDDALNVVFAMKLISTALHVVDMYVGDTLATVSLVPTANTAGGTNKLVDGTLTFSDSAVTYTYSSSYLGAYDRADNWSRPDNGNSIRYIRGTVGPTHAGYLQASGSDPWVGSAIRVLDSSPSTTGSGDMNPAHIIRECLVDPDWGMGYNASDIDEASFQASADTLYDELMGISLLWDKQMALEDFIKEIVRHINAVLYVSRTTGKFVLKLIRGDYNVEDLLVLDASSIEKVDNYSYNTFGELVNSVTVSYWDGVTDTEATLTEADPALIQAQGVVIGTTMQYPGFTNRAIASRVALRDLSTLSVPLRSCTIQAKRIAAELNIGDVFVMRWPDFSADDIVMRVIGMALGDGRSNKVRLTVTQDQFDLEAEGASTSSPPGSSWGDPTDVAADVLSPRTVYETPYAELVQVFGQSEINSKLGAEPELGYVAASGGRNGLAAAINFVLSTDSGAGYTNYGNVELCPVAYLNGAISRTATTFPIDGGVDLEDVDLGSYCKVDDEFMEVVALTADSITVGRGVLDTVIATHADNAVIFFVDEVSEGDHVAYASGAVVNVKMLTRTGTGILDASLAPVDSVTMAGRALRPYPPALVKINGSQSPTTGTETITITWAHRDRILQSDVLVSDDEASIGPETNTQYTIQAYNGATLILEQSGLSGTSATLLLAADYATLTIKIFSTRDGIESLYKQVMPVIAYTRGAAGAAYASANPGSPGVFNGTAAPVDVPVNDSLETVYDNATAVIPIISQVFGR